MLPAPIQHISNLNAAVANPASGDWLFIDIDETLLLTGLSKYKDVEPHLSEPELAATIKMLRERGIKVIGLTARKSKHDVVTLGQLKTVGIELDEIIHAPNQKHEDQNQSKKGEFLKDFINAHQQEIHDGKLKRIFVFDNLLKNLKDIDSVHEDFGVPVFLKHYTLPQYIIMTNGNDSSLFPENLEGPWQHTDLQGGTKSVFCLTNSLTNQKLVLKYGAHEDAGKLEILANAAYQALGVLVPPMRVFNQLPKNLAHSLNLSSPYGMFKVCEYIKETRDLSNEERLQLVKNTARKNFVAHTLLGNIDIAKEDNFIVDAQHNVYMIDAGANFMFRSKGRLRKEDPALASEIDSLRDPNINHTGHQWFGDISNDELGQQISEIQTKLPQVEKVVWELSEQLNIPDELRDKFLQNLSERVDILTTRLQQKPQHFAKIDKKAREGVTAAGVLTYVIKDNKPYILLSKRVRHTWWDNFGGKSDAGDETLAMTAAREVSEESNQQLNYTDEELLISPFHDIVTGDGKNQFIYRMYILQADEFDINQLNDHEHTAHLWVPLDSLLKATNAGEPVVIENQTTVNVKIDDTNIPLYPPLYHMLKQRPVFENLQRLNNGNPLAPSKTLGYAGQDEKTDDINPYRPLVTPEKKRSELALNMIKKEEVLLDIKMKDQAKSATEQKNHATGISQSELHLKALLGDQYQEANLEANVRCFVKQHFPASKAKQEKLIKKAVRLIQNEKQGDQDQFYFYHGCSNEVAFTYDVYTALYSELQANVKWSTFRPDSEHFKRFNNISEFIAFYSENGKHEICNNDKNFNDCAIAANVFLFGNHETPTSCSISYMLNNDVRRKIELSILLKNVFKPFHITDREITRLISLYNQYKTKQGGVLYQISMSHENARRMSYPAGFIGKESTFENSRDLTEILQKFKTDENLPRKQKHYIAKLQARVMLPPQLPLQVQAMSLQPLTKPLQKSYQASLKQLMNAFVFKILTQYNANNADHAQASLTKTLPSLLHANQLTYANHSPEETLITAVKANNENLVKELLQKFPSLLSKKVFLSSEYIFDEYHNRKKQKTAISVMELIIKHSKIPFEGIIDFTQEAWLDYFSKTKSHRLNEVMTRLPESQRKKLLSKHIHLLSSSNIVDALKLLPQYDRLPFATAQIEKIKAEDNVSEVAKLLEPEDRFPFVKQNMNSVNDLKYLLSFLPMQERLALAKQQSQFITSIYHLIFVLKCLPDDVRYDFSNQIEVDYYCDGIVSILKILPEESRFSFAQKHENSISGSKALAEVLAQLPQKEHLNYALRNQDKIEFDSLDEILYLLNLEDRFAFAKANANKVSSVTYIKVLLALKPENRLDYALINKEWYKHDIFYTDTVNFDKTFEVLPEKDRIQFLNKCDLNLDKYFFDSMSKWISHDELRTFMLSHINNYDALCFTLSLLPKKQRLGLVMEYRNLVNYSLQIPPLVKLLPAKKRLAFALQYKNILSGYDLGHIAELIDVKNRAQFVRSCVTGEDTLCAALPFIPLEQRLDLAKQHQALIEAGFSLTGIMNYLKPEDCLAFAIETINLKKKKFYDLADVVDYFAPDKRLYFLKQLKIDLDSTIFDSIIRLLKAEDLVEFASAFMRNQADLIATLQLLKEEERLEFVLQHQTLIENRYNLLTIIELLPAASRFAFATQVQHLIKPGDDFSSILRTLKQDERLAFAMANRDKILTRFLLICIVGELPENTQLDFLRTCANTKETLIYVLGKLPKQEVWSFAVQHQDLVTDTYYLLQVLTLIEDKDKCLEYVLANESKCTENKYCDLIAKSLPENERMPYLLRNLKDGWGVAAVLNQLPHTERLAVAYKYQRFIKTGTELCNVIEKIPDYAEKKEFLLKNQDKLDNCNSLVTSSAFIKPENQISFFTSNQNLITDHHELMSLIRLLGNSNISVHDVFDFMTSNLARLSGEQQPLPNEVVIEFVKKMEKMEKQNKQYEKAYRSFNFFHTLSMYKPAPIRDNFYDKLLTLAHTYPGRKTDYFSDIRDNSQKFLTLYRNLLMK